MNLYSSKKEKLEIRDRLVLDTADPSKGFSAPFTMAVTSSNQDTTGVVSFSYDGGESYVPWVLGATNQYIGKNVAFLNVGQTPTHIKVEKKSGSGAVYFSVNK